MREPDQAGLSRRSFVKVFAFFAAGTAVSRAFPAATALAEIQARSETDGGLLRIRLSDFPALRQDYGSIRVGTSPVGSNHLPTGLFPPVVINRAPRDVFYALEAACTHEGCIVPTFNKTADLMLCPCHGSQYSIDGEVLRGPANFALRKFQTRFDGVDQLTVELPDVSFALEVIRVGEPFGRLQLDFIAFEDIHYELRYRPNLDSDWSGPVRFALTSTGPLDQTSLLGVANIASVFVDASAPAGIYAVVMRLGEV